MCASFARLPGEAKKDMKKKEVVARQRDGGGLGVLLRQNGHAPPAPPCHAGQATTEAGRQGAQSREVVLLLLAAAAKRQGCT